LDADERARFEQALLPHLGAAYNLARWLTGNDHDAQDVVQEAYARAMKFFAGFHGGDGRPWLLTIIRNTWTSALRRQGARITTLPFDESLHGGNGDAMNPEQLALRQEDRQTVREAVAALPLELREVIVLRELEDLSYKEIAAIAGIPLGTVMSRLARARERLHAELAKAEEH